jgi:hypothetical protein
MPQVQRIGTAWDVKISDYAYTRELDRPSWGWEFLRRNRQFLNDCRMSKAGLPTPITHVSGATLLRPRRRFTHAETWGLIVFPNPTKTANHTSVFWQANILTHHIVGKMAHSNDNDSESLSLRDFSCQRLILISKNTEHLIVRNARESARIGLTGETILFEKCKCTFHIEGLSSVENVVSTLRTLTKLRDQTCAIICDQNQFELHLRDYLIALDGHLAKRSYRDIAEVIYGRDRVKTAWTNETRHLKEAVRRAVRRGIQYMEGEYRTLL